MDRSVAGRPAVHGRTRHVLGRLAVLATTGIIVAGAIGPGTPDVYGTDPTATADDPVAVDLSTGGPASPIPYVFPDDGGAGGGSGTDPSIGLRPDFAPGI